MAVALASIRDLLLPGLMEVTGKYKEIPRQWDKLFSTKPSKIALERTVTTRLLSLPQLKQEGGATQFDNNAGQRFVWNMEPVEIGLGYAITRKAIDDNLYKSQFNPTNLDMQESFSTFKEIEAAAVLNNATTYDGNLGGDGVALCSTSHPYDGGTWGNRPSVDQDLNESSLLSAMTSIRTNYVNEAGRKVMARARRLVVPTSLEAVAIRLTKTELRPGTANNDVNAILTLSGGLPDGYMVMDYLTNTRAWFLKTNIEGLVHLERIPYETDMWVDNITQNLLVTGYERYGFFYNNPRAIYGNFPTS